MTDDVLLVKLTADSLISLLYEATLLAVDVTTKCVSIEEGLRCVDEGNCSDEVNCVDEGDGIELIENEEDC